MRNLTEVRLVSETTYMRRTEYTSYNHASTAYTNDAYNIHHAYDKSRLNLTTSILIRGNTKPEWRALVKKKLEASTHTKRILTRPDLHNTSD